MKAHDTIRTMTGARVRTGFDTTKTALMVIDFQNEYFSGRMPIPNGTAALSNAKRLVEWADEHGMPVYHVQHVTPPGAPIFAEGGDTVGFHPDIAPAPHHKIVRKTSVSVFPTTNIDEQLKNANIETLVIAGLMTHACVSGAARDAVPLGYEVVVASDACATRDITGPDGKTMPHESLHSASLVTLSDTFAEILDTNAVLSLSPTGA
ncbi:cysteine hydrolase family protein [Nitratireductor soli]|uniref:cysteine hydrolase family protein n=1 Tax=Nitratireductor soli TaxID=1670619 RepID=UPI00065E81C0|nr:cysteine hydrolase family protein [Nitratireductor soli]